MIATHMRCWAPSQRRGHKQQLMPKPGNEAIYNEAIIKPGCRSMDERIRKLCAEMSAMDATAASEWLMSYAPLKSDNYRDAFVLMKCRSWPRVEQKKLANYYLHGVPFASSYPYAVFLSFMSVRSFLSCLDAFIPEAGAYRDLLAYHLGPVLDRAGKNDSDRVLIAEFMGRISG
ncbi:hypothetical protein [Stenotrophomonas maltophilia]|uniref:hypothetical protein n=2 Tax=Stenotrophomonas maltophilia TaxID=40324 RepID=UPI001953BA45|nr:hypothetical protein [Stenotrophomonas maltophilia]